MSSSQVTLRDVYDSIERLEEKLGKRFEKIETRLDSAESFRDRTLGVLSVISVFVSLAASYVWDRVLKIK